MSPTAPPRVDLLTRRHRLAWHDDRLGPRPGLSAGIGRVGGWSIPILVDGSPQRIQGGLWRAETPIVWPWLLIGVLLVAAGSPWRSRSLVPCPRRGVSLVACARPVPSWCSSSVGLRVRFRGAPARRAWGDLAFPDSNRGCGCGCVPPPSRATRRRCGCGGRHGHCRRARGRIGPLAWVCRLCTSGSYRPSWRRARTVGRGTCAHRLGGRVLARRAGAGASPEAPPAAAHGDSEGQGKVRRLALTLVVACTVLLLPRPRPTRLISWCRRQLVSGRGFTLPLSRRPCFMVVRSVGSGARRRARGGSAYTSRYSLRALRSFPQVSALRVRGMRSGRTSSTVRAPPREDTYVVPSACDPGRTGLDDTLGEFFELWGQPLGTRRLAGFRAKRGEHVVPTSTAPAGGTVRA